MKENDEQRRYIEVIKNRINSILDCSKPNDKIYLELYTNQSGYSSLKMLINGQKSVWKFSIDEHTHTHNIKVIKNRKGKWVSNDYSSLDELLEDTSDEASAFFDLGANN